MNIFRMFSVVLTVLTATGLCSFSTEKAVADTPSLYFVDMQRAIDKSIVGKAAKSDMEVEITKRQSALAQQKTEVDKLKADLDKQASLLAPDALAQKRDVIDKKERDLARQLHDQREELAKAEQAVLEIQKQIEQFGR